MAAPLTVITTRAAPPAPETRPRRATRLTTSVSQRAKIALLLFVAMVLALQALSVPVAYYAMDRLVEWVPDFSGIGTHAQWSAYLARPRAPDVLFVGDSQAFTDVDTEAISGLVSSRLGRQVAVGKLGVSGEGPDFLNALVYRVMNRPSHPRLVLLELSQATLNEFRGFDPSADLWQISEPFDPGFMARAYRVDPHRGRLARAWVLPFFMTYVPVATLAQCDLMDGMRTGFTWLGHGVPGVLRGKNPCVSSEGHVQRLNRYSEAKGYKVCEPLTRYVEETVADIRAAGADVVFLEYPYPEQQRVDPSASGAFQDRVQVLKSELGVDVFDFTSEAVSGTDAWLDSAHLTRAGARQFAARLADVTSAVYRPR